MAETDPLTTGPPPPEPTLPSYPEMIMAAIGDKNGSDKAAIEKHIESTLKDLPEGHVAQLDLHLDSLKASGQLVLVDNIYTKPDAPPRRGRGRPPKANKAPAPTGIATSPPRPRGRPPKPRDQVAEPKVVGSGRPRGRPPKKAKTEPAPKPAVSGSAPRGRGRPPKVRPAAEPVAV